MRRAWLRFANLFRKADAEREMTREMEAHLALLQEDFERRGMSPADAALAARREYGGIEQAKELHREARSFAWIEQFFRDIRYGCANLRRNPGFTLTAVIALALGIGANATVFGIYNAIALKQLPVADPSRVVRLERWFASRSLGNIQYNFAYPEYEYLRDNTSAFSTVIAAVSGIHVLAGINGSDQSAAGYAVSANYFRDLGVKPLIGRAFLPDEDRVAGASPVVVLDYRFWQAKYHGDARALGQSIKLNGVAYTIIGVAPREFTGTEAYFPLANDFFAPVSMLDQLDATYGPASDSGWRAKWRDSSTRPGFELLARLKPGVTRSQAQAAADLGLRRYLAGQKETDRTTTLKLQKAVYFGSTDDPRVEESVAGVLLVVSLVLLVACANVANMLLARGVARQREIGIRLALGASRGRVVRQLLTESLLLSLIAGVAGMLLSVWSARLVWVALINVLQGFHITMIDLDLTPDSHALLYSLMLSLLTGVCFGLTPALQATRAGLNAAMKQDAPDIQPGRSRLRGLLLGTQVTVSVVLVVVGLAVAGSSSQSLQGDPGYDARNTYALTANARPDQTLALRERLETLPELAGVAIGRLPFNGTYTVPSRIGKLEAPTLITLASDGFLDTLGIRLLRGRDFTREEAKRKAHVIVVTESTAKNFWPGQDPLGQTISFDLDFQKRYTGFEVIGVAKDARFVSISEVDPLHAYLPSAEIPNSGKIAFRVRGDANAALAAVRTTVGSMDSSLLPSLDLEGLDSFVSAERSLNSVVLWVAGVLAVLALILAGVGVYGVMAFLVSQQTREIGIRVALGATSRSVLTSILAGGLRPVAIGLGVGFALGVAANVILLATQSFHAPLVLTVFGDVSIYAALALMLAIAVVASVIPARRALRVDPAVALRHE